MCNFHQNKKQTKYLGMLLYLFAIIFGIYSGSYGGVILQNFATIIADSFINVFKFISMPIVSLSIIVTFVQWNPADNMHKHWHRALIYTITTTIIAATIACALYLFIRPENVDPALMSDASPLEGVASQSYLKHISNIIPNNIFSPFLEHQVFGVLLVSIALGMAIRYIKKKHSQKIIGTLFTSIHEVFLIFASWIVKIIPLALYAFISTTVMQLKGEINITGIFSYLSIVVIANIIQGFVILPIWLRINKVKPFYSMKEMLPALSMAFFSKSSSATLPLTIDNAEKKLLLNGKIARFILPLCTVINMNGCAAFIFTTVIYLMQNNGVEITFFTMLTWILISTVAAIGNAGVPMGCFFISASLLASMDVPLGLMGIILPFYGIIDMIETALNVWSDTCVATVINKKANIPRTTI